MAKAAKGYPQNQPFNVGARPGKKKNSWRNPTSKNYWRKTDGGRKSPQSSPKE